MKMSFPNNVGVIGAGYWGKKHVDEYTNLGVKLIVSDLVDDNLMFVKKKFGADTTKDYNDILDDDSVKAVSICTPNHTHYKIAKQCLENGKNILLEKPMTLNHRDAVDLVRIAKREGRVLTVGHIFRFNNALDEIKRLLAKKWLGDDIYIVRLSWTNLERIWERDIIFDLAPHPFDIINYLFGRNPEIVSSIGQPFRKQSGEEAAFINAKLGKTLVSLELSWLTPEKIRRLVIVGSDKTAFVECVKQQIRIYDYETEGETKLTIEPNNTLQDELRHFLECVKTNKGKSINDGEIGAEIIKVLERSKSFLNK
jgi:predicted dehydrogenase